MQRLPRTATVELRHLALITSPNMRTEESRKIAQYADESQLSATAKECLSNVLRTALPERAVVLGVWCWAHEQVVLPSATPRR